MRRFRWDKKYLYWGVTAFSVIAASLFLYLLISHLPALWGTVKKVISVLSPFIWGFVIAYLLYPLMQILQREVFLKLIIAINKGRSSEKTERLARALAVFFAIIFLLVVIAAIIWLIGPRLYLSLETIVLNSSTYLTKAYDWLDRMLADFPEIEETITSTFGSLTNGVFDWIRNSILPQMSSVLTNVTNGVIYVFRGIYNVIIGLIVSVYLLYNKNVFTGHAKKLLYCIFSLEAGEKILKAVDFIDRVFMGFLSGKILDSAIIGLICYIVCLILKMPYALLVSVIVGITNIIPFFGPIIGGVPAAIIILMESPLKCLIFVIFILVLQQFDGNFLGPKILGNSVGINGFWVMFSIILGAGLFGFAGMLLGVPVFVVLYTGLSLLVDRKLKRSDLPTDSAFYRDLRYIDPRTGEAVQKEDKRRRTAGKPASKSAKKGGGKAAPVRKDESSPNDVSGEGKT